MCLFILYSIINVICPKKKDQIAAIPLYAIPLLGSAATRR